MGCPDWLQLKRPPWIYCPGHVGVRRKERTDSFSFSFSSRWHRSARKGPYTPRPASQQSPQGCPRNSTNICPVEHRSFSTLEGGMSGRMLGGTRRKDSYIGHPLPFLWHEGSPRVIGCFPQYQKQQPQQQQQNNNKQTNKNKKTNKHTKKKTRMELVDW